jgi:hypothetical protein
MARRGPIRHFFALVFLCSAFPGSAFDFGLVIQQSPEFTNAGGNRSGELNYTGSYSPWFSSLLGKTAELYLSAKLSTVYEGGAWTPETMPLLPEAGRFEVSWRPAASVYLEAGRIRFQDPSGFIAAGNFDGFNGSVVLGKSRLSAGAFYTGLLFKETAGILMTPEDIQTYTGADSYFASRRALFSTGAEFPVLTPRSSLAVNALFQFDLNGGAYDRHSEDL